MNIEEISNEIVKLEESETNWTNIQKLAWLYAVYDHLAGELQDAGPAYRETAEVMPQYDSEFGQAVSGVNIGELMKILSEHMDVIKVLYPKEYQSVIDRIAEIP